MRNALVAVVLCAVLFMTACSAAWVSTVDSILAAAAPALVSILQIVAVANGQPMNSGLAAKITADAAAIKTLASDFSSASKLAAPGVCSQLQAAIGVYQADTQLVLSTAQVTDANTQTKIVLLSGLVAGTVDAILAVIPACQSPAATAKTLKAAPPLSLKNFVTSYNAILTAKTGNAAVDAVTPTLKLHQHSKLVRALTFGVAH
jgi:hypothetical protein